MFPSRASHFPLLACWLFLALMLTGAAVFAQPAADLAVTLEPQAVRVSDATANGKVVFTGFSREWRPYFTTNEHFRGAVQADGRAARLDIRRAIPGDSFWVAVDLATGRYGVTAPAASKYRKLEFPKNAVKANNGQLKKLDLGLPYVHLLLVRPGVGAWEMKAGDGGPADKDGGVHGRIETEPSQMSPIASSGPAPQHYDKGDLLFVFDFHQLTYFVTQVGAER